MIFKDSVGQPIEKGNIVVAAYGGELLPFVVAETFTGLDNGQPRVVMTPQFLVTKGTGPDGVVPGIILIKLPEDQNKIVV